MPKFVLGPNFARGDLLLIGPSDRIMEKEKFCENLGIQICLWAEILHLRDLDRSIGHNYGQKRKF